VRTQDEKVIELHLIPDNTIHEVKQMIQEREGIPNYKQRLFFGGKQLVDNTILKCYNIQKESTLELILTTIKLYVKTQDGKAIELYLLENNTIHEVKEMVQIRKGILSYKQRLFFGGEQLDDSSTLKYCDIQNESTLELTTTPFKLNVKTQNGQVIETYVTEYNTIREVKQMIQKCEGIPSNKQCLYSFSYYGKQLCDSNTLNYYGIREGATLELLLATLVRVKTLSGKSLTLSICDNSAIFPRLDTGVTLHLVLRLRGGMLDETSGRVNFSALPSLMQYMQVPGIHPHDKVHAGIACNYCGKSEWKGAR
jgi:hypothetical protein